MFNFVMTDAGPTSNRPVWLNDRLYSAFEAGDNRQLEWTKTLVSSNTRYPYVNKYKTDVNTTLVTEYPLVLRLAEQYLIRAEARETGGHIQQKKI